MFVVPDVALRLSLAEFRTHLQGYGPISRCHWERGFIMSRWLSKLDTQQSRFVDGLINIGRLCIAACSFQQTVFLQYMCGSTSPKQYRRHRHIMHIKKQFTPPFKKLFCCHDIPFLLFKLTGASPSQLKDDCCFFFFPPGFPNTKCANGFLLAWPGKTMASTVREVL